MTFALDISSSRSSNGAASAWRPAAPVRRAFRPAAALRAALPVMRQPVVNKPRAGPAQSAERSALASARNRADRRACCCRSSHDLNRMLLGSSVMTFALDIVSPMLRRYAFNMTRVRVSIVRIRISLSRKRRRCRRLHVSGLALTNVSRSRCDWVITVAGSGSLGRAVPSRIRLPGRRILTSRILRRVHRRCAQGFAVFMNDCRRRDHGRYQNRSGNNDIPLSVQDHFNPPAVHHSESDAKRVVPNLQ